MALTNPAKSLYYNAEQYYKLKKEQTNNTPKTGLLGQKNNSNFMSTKISSNNGEESPAQRAANYFITLRNKRMELNNGNTRTT